MSTPQRITSGSKVEKNQYRVDRGVKKEKFEGRKEELSGYTFDITTARNSNNYSRTLKEIARHVGSSSKHGADLKRTIETEIIFNVERPVRPITLVGGETPDEEEINAIETDIYREDIKNYV